MSTPKYLHAFAEQRKLTRDERTELTYVDSYLRYNGDAATLQAMHGRRKQKWNKEGDALWAGMYQLRRLAEESLTHAIVRGQLLFCFPGTTVLQGGAA